MQTIYFILIILIIAFGIYYMSVKNESFNVSSYESYITDLANDKVPFSRVFSRDAYNIISSAENPEVAYKKMIDITGASI